MGAEAVQN